MSMQFNELPHGFQLRYRKSYPWKTQPVRLIRFGAVKHSSNPYFATQEKQVEGKVTRLLGSRPLSDYTAITVEREDSTLWSVQLGNFESYEYIEQLEND